MPQLAFAGGQSVGDIAQAVDRTQLAEQRGYQLASVDETLGIVFGVVFADSGISTLHVDRQLAPEILQRLAQAFLQRNLWLPAQQRERLGNVWAASRGVILGQRLKA